MKLEKQKALGLLGNYPDLKYRIEHIKGDFVMVEVMSETSYKSLKQNSLFHSLLSVFGRVV